MDFSRLAYHRFYAYKYEVERRRWFVEKIVQYVRGLDSSAGLNDRAIFNQAKALILRARPVAQKSKAGINIGIDPFDREPFDPEPSLEEKKLDKRRRIQLTYGLIAENPSLLKPENRHYLDFLIRRRYRTIIRMRNYVNSGKDYFNYLDVFDDEGCAGLRTRRYRLSSVAEPGIWMRPFSVSGHELSGEKGYERFFKLQPSVNTPAKLVDAVKKLFHSPSDVCDGSFLDCPTVFTIIGLDTFLLAEDPGKLLKVTQDIRPGTDNLSINHPFAPPKKNFLTDNTENGLFEQKSFDQNDLQIGDHLFIYNHPLYLYFSTGAWQGEHAVVAKVHNHAPPRKEIDVPALADDKPSKEAWNKYKKLTTFSGHGMREENLLKMWAKFLDITNTELSKQFGMCMIHLRRMEAERINDGIVLGGPSVKKSGEKTLKHRKWEIKDDKLNLTEVEGRYVLYEYDETITYKQFAFVPPNPTETDEPGIEVPTFSTRTERRRFVISQSVSPDDGHFYHETRKSDKDRSTTIEDVLNRTELKHLSKYPLKYVRLGLSGFIPEQWALEHIDKSKRNVKSHLLLFQKFIPGHLQARNLTLNDMAVGLDRIIEAPFSTQHPSDWSQPSKAGNVFVTRPRNVDDNDGAYRKMLEKSGAIRKITP